MSRRAEWAAYRAQLREMDQELARLATPPGQPPSAEYAALWHDRMGFAANRKPETLREVLAEHAELWRGRGLARAMEAGYNDRAGTQAAYKQMVAETDAADARFWAGMRADGVDVTDPEPEPEAEPEAGL